MKLAVDVMSGDFGPEPIVDGVIDAIKEFRISIIIVGDPDKIHPLLKKNPTYKRDNLKKNIEILSSKEIIYVEESPASAVRKKKNASVVLAAKKVGSNDAFGFFSPGNTGATLASSIQHLGRISGIKRPALGIPLPRFTGGVTLLIDGGANVDCKPEWLTQFAVMGEVYSREIFGVVNPKIGLLSNGEEDKKGNEQTLKAFSQIKKLPFDFVGNVEGRDLYGFGKQVDVVVTDGFIGNIVLKNTEGLGKAIFSMIKSGIAKSNFVKTGAFFLKSTLRNLIKKIDYTEYGGVPLLGVNGIVIIGHGSSNAKAVKNAIKAGYRALINNINPLIEENITRFVFNQK